MKTADAETTRSDFWDVRRTLDESFRQVRSILDGPLTDADPRLRLAACAEIRQHIALAERVLESASSAEAARVFQEIVLDALGAASLKVRKRVLEVLNERLESRCVSREAAQVRNGV